MSKLFVGEINEPHSLGMRAPSDSAVVCKIREKGTLFLYSIVLEKTIKDFNMAGFIKFVGWVASKGKKYVDCAWSNKRKIIDWLNIGYTFTWIYEEIKKRIG